MKDSRRCYLVEDFTSGIFLDDGQVVSLSPEACFALEKNKIPFSIIEDYYSERDMVINEAGHFTEQLEWMRGLDRIIKEKVPVCAEHDLNLITQGHYLPFKYLTDSAIIQSYVIREFLEKAQPQEVIYVYDSLKRKTSLNIFDWVTRKTTLYKDYLALLAEERGFKFDLIDIKDRTAKDIRTSPVNKDTLFYQILKGLLKPVLNLIRYRKPLFSLRQPCGLNFFFLHAGCEPIDNLIKSLVRRKAKVFIKEGNNVYREDLILRKKVLSGKELINQEMLNESKKELSAVFSELCSRGRLFDWLNERCKFDVSPVIRPYFLDFFEEVCARNLAESQVLLKFYQDEKIDFVVARAGTDRVPVSGILAANYFRRAKTVCFQHGCMALDHEASLITETGMFDAYFTTDDLSMEYFLKHPLKEISRKCTILQDPYVFKQIKDSKKNARGVVNKNTILYLPTNLPYFCRSFNNLHYPITWYYTFQKRLLDFFSGKKDFLFLYKVVPSQKWAEESILPYLKDKGFTNIVPVYGTIPEYLPKAQKVLIDYPSTPLFEAAAYGTSILAVFIDYFKKWEPASHYFKDSLQGFSSIEDALRRIDAFLDCADDRFQTSLPMQERNDTLEMISNLKNEP